MSRHVDFPPLHHRDYDCPRCGNAVCTCGEMPPWGKIACALIVFVLGFYAVTIAVAAVGCQ